MRPPILCLLLLSSSVSLAATPEQQMLLEIQRAVSDRDLRSVEALQIVAAAGPAPSLEAIAIAQRLVGELPPLLKVSTVLMTSAGDDLGKQNQVLGRLVVRHALGQPDLNFPGTAVSTLPPEGTPLTVASLETWMRSRGIVDLRADVLLQAFAVWHVSHQNFARLEALTPGDRFAVGEFDYVRPGLRGDEAQIAAKVAKYAERIFNDKYRLTMRFNGKAPVPEGRKSLLWASEAAEFDSRFVPCPTFAEVLAGHPVSSPPAAAWIEAIDPSTPTSVDLRLLSQLIDLADAHGRLHLEKSFWKDAGWDDLIDPGVSAIATTRWIITPAAIRRALHRLIGTTHMANGGSGIDQNNFDDRLGIELENDQGQIVGRVSLRALLPPYFEASHQLVRPRTALRLPGGDYLQLRVGFATATLGHEYFAMWARGFNAPPEPRAPAKNVYERATPFATGVPPASLAEAIALPAPAPWPQFTPFATSSARSYVQASDALLWEDGRNIAPPGVDFYSARRVVAPERIYWVTPRAYLWNDVETDAQLERLRLEHNFYAEIELDRGLIAYDLRTREWLRYPVPRPALTPMVVTMGKWRVEEHPDGDVLIHRYQSWDETARAYVEKDTPVSLRGVAPIAIGQGYYTPLWAGTVY